jgi:hypothetical protein
MDTGKGYKSVVSYVMGTRWDLAPTTMPEVFYTYVCGLCKTTTYTEKEFSQGETVICNVCASQMTSQGAAEPYTDVVWDLPPDLMGRLVTEAQRRGVPPEDYVIGFLEWKTGRELPQIRLFNREEKQIYIVKKRRLP